MLRLHKALQQGSPWLDYVIIAMTLLLCGTPAIMGSNREEPAQILVSFIFSVILLFRTGRPFTTRLMVVVSVFSFILAMQCVDFGFWPFHTMVGFLLRVYIGFAAVRLVKDFPRRYVRLMCCLCIVSFFFHSLAVLRETTGLNLIQYLAPVDKIANPSIGFNVIVHQYTAYGKPPADGIVHASAAFRNCSCFWEPGVFSAYCSLALVFLGLTRERYDKRRYKWMCTVLVVAILTTVSTAGYALLPVCMLFHIRGVSLTPRGVSTLLRASALVAILCAAGYHLDFVGGKIKEHITSVVYRTSDSEGNWEMTRFGTLVYDLETYISKRPFLGWGLHAETRYAMTRGDSNLKHGNGLSDFAAKLGLLGLATFFIAICSSGYTLTNRQWKRTLLFVLFVAAVLNGERLLNFPIYLGLMFLGPVPGTIPINAHPFRGRWMHRRAERVSMLGRPRSVPSITAGYHI